MTPRLETPEEAAVRLAGERLREHERATLWARIEASTAASGAGSEARRRTARRRMLGFAAPAFALATAAAAVFGLRGWLQDRDGAQRPAVAAGCSLDAGSARLALAAHCRPAAVQVSGDEWLLRGGSEVARTPEGSRVAHGRVRFRVRPRTHAQPPFRVRVSHGEVRVIGTVFEVSQQAGRGFVTVSEGVIEFVWDDGARERVASGQTLHWPRRAAQPTAPVAARGPLPAAADAGRDDADATGRGPSGAPPVDLDRVLERLLQLQSQKRFGEAVSLLRGTLGAHGLHARQRERISYELGLALEADAQPSCAHWRRHVERYGSGGHGTALAERLARCREP